MKKVFSKEKYIEVRGMEAYERHKGWVDACDGHEVKNGMCNPEGYGPSYVIEDKYCIPKSSKRNKAKESKKADELELDLSKAAIVRVDHEELHKQSKEAILKSGHYCLFELILPLEGQAFCQLEAKNINRPTMVNFIADLESTLEDIKKEYPMEAMLAKLIGVEKQMTRGEREDKGNEEE